MIYLVPLKLVLFFYGLSWFSFSIHTDLHWIDWIWLFLWGLWLLLWPASFRLIRRTMVGQKRPSDPEEPVSAESTVPGSNAPIRTARNSTCQRGSNELGLKKTKKKRQTPRLSSRCLICGELIPQQEEVTHCIYLCKLNTQVTFRQLSLLWMSRLRCSIISHVLSDWLSVVPLSSGMSNSQHFNRASDVEKGVKVKGNEMCINMPGHDNNNRKEAWNRVCQWNSEHRADGETGKCLAILNILLTDCKRQLCRNLLHDENK